MEEKNAHTWIKTWTELAKKASPEQLLKELSLDFPGKVCFSSSLGWEDQVITHFILSQKLDIEIFTLDTGRLFQETYFLMERIFEKYGKRISSYFPRTREVEKLVSTKGANSFYESVENRKECCQIRKVEPLQRALEGKEIWLTGIRSQQSQNRSELPMMEWDGVHHLIKVHPILNWSLEEVKSFIHQHEIPYNPLHDQGFISIGCAPCTRAVQPGEDIRAGRWWWEDQSKKECGLHLHQEFNSTS
ncbi:MAG: phosphoadenylyl-sulfate reductase [Chitinophagaceae bacterium]